MDDNALYWVIENSDGEAIDVIYQHDPNISQEWLDLLDEMGWTISGFVSPEPAWEFFSNLRNLVSQLNEDTPQGPEGL